MVSRISEPSTLLRLGWPSICKESVDTLEAKFTAGYPPSHEGGLVQLIFRISLLGDFSLNPFIFWGVYEVSWASQNYTPWKKTNSHQKLTATTPANNKVSPKGSNNSYSNIFQPIPTIHFSGAIFVVSFRVTVFFPPPEKTGGPIIQLGLSSNLWASKYQQNILWSSQVVVRKNGDSLSVESVFHITNKKQGLQGFCGSFLVSWDSSCYVILKNPAEKSKLNNHDGETRSICQSVLLKDFMWFPLREISNYIIYLISGWWATSLYRRIVFFEQTMIIGRDLESTFTGDYSFNGLWLTGYTVDTRNGHASWNERYISFMISLHFSHSFLFRVVGDLESWQSKGSSPPSRNKGPHQGGEGIGGSVLLDPLGDQESTGAQDTPKDTPWFPAGGFFTSSKLHRKHLINSKKIEITFIGKKHGMIWKCICGVSRWDVPKKSSNISNKEGFPNRAEIGAYDLQRSSHTLLTKPGNPTTFWIISHSP